MSTCNVASSRYSYTWAKHIWHSNLVSAVLRGFEKEPVSTLGVRCVWQCAKRLRGWTTEMWFWGSQCEWTWVQKAVQGKENEFLEHKAVFGNSQKCLENAWPPSKLRMSASIIWLCTNKGLLWSFVKDGYPMSTLNQPAVPSTSPSPCFPDFLWTKVCPRLRTIRTKRMAASLALLPAQSGLHSVAKQVSLSCLSWLVFITPMALPPGDTCSLTTQQM